MCFMKSSDRGSSIFNFKNCAIVLRESGNTAITSAITLNRVWSETSVAYFSRLKKTKNNRCNLYYNEP